MESGVLFIAYTLCTLSKSNRPFPILGVLINGYPFPSSGAVECGQSTINSHISINLTFLYLLSL